jgi:RNA polymerase sigma-70 factor (ECF subfamily)
VEFETHRPLLFSIAYRMTGSAADAEDLVQDAYLRFASAAQGEIRDTKAFLVTVITRLALDRLKSAQHRREEYVGPWLPEPVLTGIDGDPYARVMRDENVELALLRALERLSPQERAVLLLYEVLDHDHNEIASILGITSASSRQILHRAKERVSDDRRRFTPPAEQQRMLIDRFMHALAANDVDGLRQVLAADVVSLADGGGKTFASKRPLHGFDMVARLFRGLVEKYSAGIEYEVRDVNGAPALLMTRGDRVESILTFTFEGERIIELAAIVNPDKLTVATRQWRAIRRPAP